MKVSEETRTRKLRELAKEVAASAELAGRIGYMLPSVTKSGKGRVSEYDLYDLEFLREEYAEMFSDELAAFLKKGKNIPLFVSLVREEILAVLSDDSEPEPVMEDIIEYSMCFNIKHLKNVKICNRNLMRLALVLAVDATDPGCWDEDKDANQLQRLFDDLEISSCSSNMKYIDAVCNLRNLLK